MMDGHDAGEPPDPRRETPAPDRDEPSTYGSERQREPFAEQPAAPAMSPVRQGIRAALIIFACSVAVELFSLLVVRLSGDPDNLVVGVFLIAGLLIFIAGLFAALTVSQRLPSAARVPFWAMGVLCAFLSMILWGVTCGLAGTPRFN